MRRGFQRAVMPRNQTVYDAIIVGSGASGGWVAKQLTEQGMRVLMLEAGPPRLPTRDFTEHVCPYQVKFRGFGNRQALLERQPIQRLCYACDEFSHQFFVDDHENPYTFPLDKPFMWIRGRQVGGKTFCWARESYRYSDYEFKAASRDGYGEDWPFRYKDLEPYYEKVNLRSEEHTSELQSRGHLVCRLLLEKKKQDTYRQKIKEKRYIMNRMNH